MEITSRRQRFSVIGWTFRLSDQIVVILIDEHFIEYRRRKGPSLVIRRSDLIDCEVLASRVRFRYKGPLDVQSASNPRGAGCGTMSILRGRAGGPFQGAAISESPYPMNKPMRNAFALSMLPAQARRFGDRRSLRRPLRSSYSSVAIQVSRELIRTRDFELGRSVRAL